MGADFLATIERCVMRSYAPTIPGDAWSVVELFELCGRSGPYADVMRDGDPQEDSPPDLTLAALRPELSPLVRWRFDPSRCDMLQHDPPYWIRLYSARDFLDRVGSLHVDEDGEPIARPEGLDDVIEMLVAICQRYGKDYEHRVCLWYGP